MQPPTDKTIESHYRIGGKDGPWVTFVTGIASSHLVGLGLGGGITRAGGDKPEEFAAFVRSELQQWGKVVKDAGIKIQ